MIARLVILLIVGLLVGRSVDACENSCAAIGPKEHGAKDAGAEALSRDDFERAYDLWLPLACEGDAEVQEALALLLVSDHDLGVDYSRVQRDAKAVEWIIRSARAGNFSAMRWLAQAIESGWMGLVADSELAKCWHAASNDETGNSQCQHPEMRNFDLDK